MKKMVVLALAALFVAAGAFAGQIDRERTLIWAVPATPNGMDHEIHYSLEAMEAQTNVYDSLLAYSVKQDPSGFLVPDFTNIIGALAESWEFSDDNLTITVHIRKGVMSHDGNELTADDFMYKQERGWELNQGIKNFAGDGQKLYDLGKQLKKIDKYTFSITTETPNPIAESMLTHLAQHLFDSVVVKAKRTAADSTASTFMATNTAGHGPYKLVMYAPGQQLVFDAFEDYWDKDNVAWFKRVIMREVPQSSNRVALLMHGSIDAATKLSASELQMLENQPGVNVMHYTGNLVTRVEFNNTVAPFDNKDVRKALCYATPYQDILDTVYLGTATQSKSVIPSIYPGYNPSFWNYSTDFAKAKELLAQAGYPDGFRTKLTINAGVPQQEQIAILLQSAFRNIGVQIDIEKMQTGDYYNKVAQHSFDAMYIFEDSPGVVDGGFPIKLWAQQPSTQNMGEYRNEEVNRLYNLSKDTMDAKVRQDCFDRIQQIVVDEDPLWIFLVEPGYHLAIRDGIEGVQWNTLQQIRWNYMKRTK
ncbi:MAG: ABC transporter substrate-binding protein [Planctomycetes bacterium]|nr:ABC transporter substrate-binding protein [Planctomycetota bacterium]